jgi:hypothetical protein
MRRSRKSRSRRSRRSRPKQTMYKNCINDNDPITGEYIEDIPKKDIVAIKSPGGDILCFDRYALLDELELGPVIFPTKQSKNNIFKFMKEIAECMPASDKMNESDAVYDIHSLISDGKIRGKFDYGSIARIFGAAVNKENSHNLLYTLNYLFSLYRVYQWPLDNILIISQSIDFLANEKYKNFKLMRIGKISNPSVLDEKDLKETEVFGIFPSGEKPEKPKFHHFSKNKKGMIATKSALKELEDLVHTLSQYDKPDHRKHKKCNINFITNSMYDNNLI